MVRRAYREPVDAVSFAAQFLQVPLEALGLGEELRLAIEAIQNPYRVMWIERGDELATDVFDGLHVAGGDEASGADECESRL